MAHYEIAYVARSPQQLSSPNLVELGRIPGSVSWVEDKYGPGGAEVVAPTNKLDAELKSRLRDLENEPTEIWVYRDGVIVFAGPIVSGSISETSITMSCSGLLAYLQYMLIPSDKTFDQIDQALIAQELVDDWQALDYGNFGLDTSAIAAHGTLRDAKYVGAEYRNVLEEVLALGETAGGFDPWVDPTSRELVLDSPSRGSDLSSSVFLERGITSPNIRFSVAPGLIASEAFATADIDGTAITDAQVNATLRSTFGRAGYAESFDAASAAELADQNAHALELRNHMLFQPGPGLVPVDGAKVPDFGPGDIVSYTYDAGLGQQTGFFVVRTKSVQATNDTELIQVEFD